MMKYKNQNKMLEKHFKNLNHVEVKLVNYR